MRNTRFQAGDYINSILSTACPNLHAIEINGGGLRQYNNDSTIPKRGQYVHRLLFDETRINEKCLGSLLTNEFPKLELLQLTDCSISGSIDNGDQEMENSSIHVTMPETDVGTLSIKRCDFIARPMLLIPILSTEQSTTKYYIDVCSRQVYGNQSKKLSCIQK